MSQVRKKDAFEYSYDDSRRYITAKDCLTEPEVLKAYCESHPETVCVGGHGFLVGPNSNPNATPTSDPDQNLIVRKVKRIDKSQHTRSLS